MPFLALLAGPLGRLGGYAMLALAIGAGVLWWLHEHDAGVRAEMQASADAVIAQAARDNEARVNAAVEKVFAEDAARFAQFTAARKAVRDAPQTTACAHSPAVGRALDGLRRPGPDRSGATPAHP